MSSSATPPAEAPELFAIVQAERLARDTGDWDAMRALYWPDSVVRVTWFTGTAEEFIQVSAQREPDSKRRGMHLLVPARAQVDGDRATVESLGEIHIRPRLDGVQCDVISWCRFFSRLERRDGEWRMTTFDSIYIKDRVQPVDPADSLILDPELLARGRESYKHLSYLNRSGGFTVPDDLPGNDRPDLLDAFYADADAWLHGQPGPDPRGDAA